MVYLFFVKYIGFTSRGLPDTPVGNQERKSFKQLVVSGSNEGATILLIDIKYVKCINK